MPSAGRGLGIAGLGQMPSYCCTSWPLGVSVAVWSARGRRCLNLRGTMCAPLPSVEAADTGIMQGWSTACVLTTPYYLSGGSEDAASSSLPGAFQPINRQVGLPRGVLPPFEDVE